MPSKNPVQRLRDIVENVDLIQELTAGMDRDAFSADRKTVYAVVRALEVISEASRRLPAELKNRRLDIDWVGIAAAGNVYRHEYEGVDAKLVWHTVRHSLDELRTIAALELERLGSA